MKAYQMIIFLTIALLMTGCMTLSPSGEYSLDSGKTLHGDLIMTSGEAILEDGSRVTGDVIMTSGVLNVDGQVDGDILFTSAESINLGPNSVVGGNIKGTAGDIFRAEGSQVGGEITKNQAFTFSDGFFAKVLGLLCGLPVVLILSVIYWLSGRRKKHSDFSHLSVNSKNDNIASTLKQLKQMLEDGLIREVDYEVKKADILARL